MSRRLFSLAIFWLASTVPSALEMNAAGDMALMESGLYFVEKFTDPALPNWTVDAGVLGTNPITDRQHAVVDPAGGGKLVLYKRLFLMRYTGPVHSPTLSLPAAQMCVDGLNFWNPLDLFDDRSMIQGATLGVASETPWQYYHFVNNHQWAGNHVNFGYQPDGGAFTYKGGLAGLVADQGPEFLGLFVEPDAVTTAENKPLGCGGVVCGDGYNRNCIQGHGPDWTCSAAGAFCESENYGLTGWPAIASWNANAQPATQRAEYYEMYGWKHHWIEVQCVPEGYYCKIIRNAGQTYPPSAYVSDARTISTSQAQDGGEGWISDGVGTFTQQMFCVYGGNNTYPYHHTLEIRKASDDSLLTSITPSSFQTGVFGGDVYTLCVEGLTSPCPPLLLTSFFFFGAGLSPTSLLRETVSLDAIVVTATPEPSGSMLLETGDKALLEGGDDILLEG